MDSLAAFRVTPHPGIGYTAAIMRRLAMIVQYDGTAYHGWQRQPGLPTVQGTLEAELARLLGEAPAVDGAGRTDAGVHALGQVAAFSTGRDLAPGRIERALNSRLPDDVAVADAREVAPDFDPSRDAVSKHYRYRLYTGAPKPIFRRHVAWHWYRPLDVAPMQAAAQLLVGRHDFASFESRGSARENTVREVFSLDATRDADEVRVDVTGDGFLYRMVRNLVGTLTEVGRGHRPPEWVREVLVARDRTAGGPCAPPRGLCLMSVRYPA